MYGDLSLNPEKEFEGISLLPATAPKYDVTHLDDLSLKYDQALGPVSPGPAVIQKNIVGGTQSRLQQLMAQQQINEIASAKNGIIQQIANGAGNEMSMDVINVVQGLSIEELQSHNLGAILEERYAKQVVNAQVNASPDEYDESIITDPNGTSVTLDRSEWAAAKNMVSSNLLNDLQTKYGNTPLPAQVGGWLADNVFMMGWIRKNTQLTGDNVDAFLPGDRTEQIVTQLHSLRPDVYKAELEKLVKGLVDSGGIVQAMELVQATLSYGESEKGLENVFAVTDVASLVPIGLLGKALKGAIKGARIPLKEAETAAKVAGREEIASRIAFSEALSEGRLPSTTPGVGARAVERNFNSISRPQEMFVGKPMRASAAVVSRMQTAALTRASKIMEFFGVNKVSRVTPEELSQAYNETEEAMRRIFSDQNHHILDVRRIEPDNYTNIGEVEFKLGQKDGTFFSNKNAAERFAGKWIKLRTKDYSVEKETSGWSVTVRKHVDESKIKDRDLSIETDSPEPDGLWNRITKGIKGRLPNWSVGRDVEFDRSLKKEIGQLQKEARLVASSSHEEANHLIMELTKPFGTLNANKAEFKEWNNFIKKSRDLVDPVRGRGVTYETMADFEDAWHQMFNKLPSESQMDAFDAYKQIKDLENTVRALDVHKQKAIIGIEKFDLNVFIGQLGKDEAFAAKHKAYVEPLEFEGKEIDNLPRDHSQGFTVAIVDDKGVIQKKYSRFMTDETQWDNITKLKEQGYKIIQPYEGSVKVGDNRYNFVIVKNVQRGRIKPDFSYNSATRTVNRYPWFIKQGRVSIDGGNARYFGDTALANARDAEEANFIAGKLEEVRKLMKGKASEFAARPNRATLKEAKRIFEENLPMWKFDDYLKSLREGKLNLDVPVMPVRQGQRLTDVGFSKKTLQGEGLTINNFDDSNAFDLSRGVRGKFLGDVEETDMRTWGVENDSIFELTTDSVLDPLDTLRLSSGNMVDVNVMNDYKIKSIRDFTQQYGQWLDDSKDDLAINGLSFIYQPKYVKGIPQDIEKQAEGVRKAILSMLNHNTYVDRALATQKEKLVRSLRKGFGDKGAEWIGEKILTKIQNADYYMRSFAFATKFFFNPKQFFLQAQSTVNVVAISPVHGARAAMLFTPIMAGLHANPKALGKVARLMAKAAGVSEEDYIELVQMYRRSGFSRIGKSTAHLDDFSPPSVVRGTFSKVMDAGPVFYNAGERVSRTMAFAAAYLERKAMKKGSTAVVRAPAPKAGMIRFYHGTTSDNAKGFSGKTFVTPEENYARNYHGNNNNVLYTDLTKKEAIDRGLYDEVNGYAINGSIDDGALRLKNLETKGSGALTRADEASILKRADTMTGNMGRASKAAYQEGYPAVATQFFGYQMRLMEQMLGLSGNLTRMERARMFGFMSFLYGVPVASGMTLGVWPVREYIKDWLAEEKIDYKGTAMEPFIDGFASQWLEAVTGTDFNVEEKLAPGGLTTFYDLLKGDAELSEMLYGASGGIILDTWKAADPIFKWSFAAIDMNDLTSYPVTFEDIVAPFKEASVINSGWKIYMAANLGSWVSKNQTNLTDITPFEAFLSGTLGIDPERVSDTFNSIEAMNKKTEIQKYAIKEYVKWYRLGTQALKAGDNDTAAIYFGRSKAAVATGGLTMRQEVEARMRALDETPLDEATFEKFSRYEPIKGK